MGILSSNNFIISTAAKDIKLDNPKFPDSKTVDEALSALYFSGLALIDAEVIYLQGYFSVVYLPSKLPDKFTLRFTSPAAYSQGDRIKVGDTLFDILSPGMETISSNAFAADALVSMDIDNTSGKAFFKSGTGGGGDTIEIGYTARIAGNMRALTSMTSARTYMLQCVIGSELIGACGYNGSAYEDSPVVVYDYAKNTSRNLQTMSTRHSNINMGCVVGDEIIVIGGYIPGQYVNHAANEAVNVKTNTKRTLAQLTLPRAQTAVAVINGEIIIPAGASSGAPKSSIEGLDPATNTKRTLSVSLSNATVNSITGTINGSVITAGGEKDNGVTFVNTIEYINPATDTKKILSATLSYTGSTGVPSFAATESRLAVMLCRGNAGQDFFNRNIDVINPVTDTKQRFTLPYGVTGNPSICAKSSNEIIIDFTTNAHPNYSGNVQMLVVLNIDTGELREIITKEDGSWNSFISGVFGNEYVKACGSMTEENPTAQVQGVNLGDAGDTSIPYLYADTGMTPQSKLNTTVKIPYPATYKGVTYPANKEITMLDSDIFNLDVPTGTETAEIKYLVQKGVYHL